MRVTREAIRWTGKNVQEVHDFVESGGQTFTLAFGDKIEVCTRKATTTAPEERALAGVGDYPNRKPRPLGRGGCQLVKNADGSIRPCKPERFEQLYTEV